MAGRAKRGWVKDYRIAEESPVWPHHNAARVLQWAYRVAEPDPTEETTADGVVRLDRGQFYASYPEIADRCYLSVDQVKRAFGVLARLGEIAREKKRRGMVVTLVNYRETQDRIPSEDKGDEGEKSAREGRTELRTATSTAEPGESAPQNSGANGDGGGELGGAGDGDAHGTIDADRTATSIATSAAINKEEEVKEEKEETQPPSFFSKNDAADGKPEPDSGLLLGSEADRLRLALALWRTECEAVGLFYAETDSLVETMAAVAAAWTVSLVISREQMQLGMRKLIDQIKNDTRCESYTPRALLKSPHRYFNNPAVKQRRRQVQWKLVCDVCGHVDHTEFLPADAPPPAEQDCSSVTLKRWHDEMGKPRIEFEPTGCQGRMRPKIALEKFA